MSFEIPAYIEPQVQRFAKSQHITANEAVVRRNKAGLDAQLPPHRSGNIWGMGAEDADVLDAVADDAMAERRNRFGRRLDA
jgi:hypothetical protein